MKKLIFILLLVGQLTTAKAAEHWTHYPAGQMPWITPMAMMTFKDAVYISAAAAKNGGSNLLWKSTDGDAWSAVTVPAGFGSVQSFTEHKGLLYALTVDLQISNLTPPRQIFRTADGSTWEKMNGNFGNGMWSDSISHYDSISNQTYLFVAAAENQSGIGLTFPTVMWRTTGDGVSPLWSASTDPTLHPSIIKLSSFNGYLYATTKFRFSFGDKPERGSLHRSHDGSAWEARENNINGAPMLAMDAGLTIFNDWLYWTRKSDVLRTQDNLNVPVTEIQWPTSFVGDQPVPLVVHDQLHVFVSSAVVVMNASGQWEAAASDGPNMCQPGIAFNSANVSALDRFNDVAHLNDKAFVIPCDVWMLKKGVAALNPIPLGDSSIAVGQKNITLLSWNADVNFGDVLKSIRVRNIGSASGSAIASVKLYFRGSDPRINPQLATPLDLQPDGRSWASPSAFTQQVRDGDTYFVIVDLADGAGGGQTLQLAVDRLETESGVLPAGMISSLKAVEKSIAAPAGASATAIEGVLIYPKPARESVRFMYDLESAADIEIRLFDVNGNDVGTIRESKPAGNRTISTWDSSRAAPGIYHAIIKIRPSSGGERQFKERVYIGK